MTWNIHGGTPGARQAAALLQKPGADIVLLQEAWNPESGRYPYPLRSIQAAFPGWYFARTAGNALLSRFPIVDSESRPLGRYRKRLMAHIRIGESAVGVINVHLNTAGTGRKPGPKREEIQGVSQGICGCSQRAGRCADEVTR
ncbi:MAG: endonuclease/exonuclease/phosphatase family protein [Armatimonadetes bacterium]|nr:endonuclease/exonuclease/phosphatase family protein [Armatimonadota bacterium]